MSKEITSVKELIQLIAETRTQTSANAKDENRVAMAMLNDSTFSVDVYKKDGVAGVYSPYEETRAMIASIIQDTTKIPEAEATRLASEYQFGRAEAQTMINFGKEFINTYLETGRKLPLGCRERSNCSLVRHVKEARTNSFPIPTGVDANGNKVYETTTGRTPEYSTIKVSGACPAHLKAKANGGRKESE